jgi:hypothetical protein
MSEPSLMIPIEDLIPHPENYVEHPQAQLNEIKASLLRFGQRKSIIVQRNPGTQTYTIIAGHGLREAVLQLLEDGNIPAKVRDQFRTIKADPVPDDWTPAQSKGYMLADNETSRKAVVVELQLASLLEEQLRSGEDLTSVGSSEADLQELLDRLGDEILDDEPGDYEDDEEDLAEISDEDKQVETMQSLKFGKYRVPLTDEEFLMLEERVKLYGEEYGSYYGFIRKLLTA